MNTNKTILLVEDDEEDQFFFVEALSEIENASLFAIAQNGQDALGKLRGVYPLPDIIFMDIQMPVMGGIECLEQMGNNPRYHHIPVVILSSSAEDKEVAHTLGAKAFIKKPSDIRALKNKMEEIIKMDFIADNKIAEQTFRMSYTN